MFCTEPENENMEMPCFFKGIYELVSFISLICSLFVIIVTVKNIKMNLMHKLIIQIIISEIIDEINILLGIISDSSGNLHFENYEFRIRICYTQIYLSVFSCLWTLTSSLFISLKLYDIIINNNKIFNGNIISNKHILFISICVPLFISYIFWVIQSIKHTSNITLNTIYDNKIISGTQMIKLVFCWLNKDLTIALACIVSLLIIANLYFSLIKGYLFLRQIKNEILAQNEEANLKINERIKNINQIQKILFLYPIIACVIWVLFFLFMFLFYFSYRDHQSTGWSIVFCIFMAIRQLIYTLVYFLSQKKLLKRSIMILTCKTCKKRKDKRNTNNANKQTEYISLNDGDK